MLLVMFINIRYLCISVYIFRQFCMSVCRIDESVHIKTGIDLFTKHKANITQISSKFIKTSHTNISCINCNCTCILLLPSEGSAAQYKKIKNLLIFITTVMTLDWIANGISS